MHYFEKNCGPTQLRQLLKEEKVVVAPGCYDGLSARILQSAGFSALYLTGHGISVSLLGQSDIALTGMGEVINRAKDVINAVVSPVILDIDTGYGGPLNIQRTIREAEQAGVSGIQIEDQLWPKKCGHMEGKRVVSADEMLKRLETVLAARQTELVVIARTDARAVFGIDEAIRRANMYLKAGADIAFIDGPESLLDLQRMTSEVKGWVLANYVEGGKTPLLTISEYEKMGFKLIIYPLSLMYASAKAMMNLADELKVTESTGKSVAEDRLTVFNDFNKFIGLEKMYEIEKRYSCLK